MAYKGTETDILYEVAMYHAVMAYKGTETDVLYGMEMLWRADATQAFSQKGVLGRP
jgi:hypothetical protein